MAKISFQDAKNIRKLYKTGNYTGKDLANKYNCSRSNISFIVNNKTRRTTSPKGNKRKLVVDGAVYYVYDTGKIYSLSVQRYLIGGDNGVGYKTFALGKNEKQFYISHLVLKLFVGKRPKGYDACHKDGNPGNNKLSNLMWGSRSENANHKQAHKTVCKGLKAYNGILSTEVAYALSVIHKFCGKKKTTFSRYMEPLLNVNKGTIRSAIQRPNYGKLARKIRAELEAEQN